MTGFPAWIKAEGVVLSLLLGLGFLAALAWGRTLGQPRKVLPGLGAFAIPWLATVLAWHLVLGWNRVDGPLQAGAFTGDAITGALSRLDRWGVIWPYFARAFGRHGAAIAAGGLVSIASAIRVPRLRRTLAFLWSVYLGQLAFLLLVFLSTQLDVAWHLSTSFDRLASQGAFTFTLAAFVGISSLAEGLTRRLPQCKSSRTPMPSTSTGSSSITST
jgi:hypothetical protein